ncbi:MAG: hypothetical protein IPG86_03390 [Chitinophagaceae bacterium]|nr:hypothetical protein [Chitinophagaceae bacterium]
MESNPQESTLFELQYDEELKSSLQGAAKWAGMAALVSFISTIIGMVSFFIQRAKMQAMYREYAEYGISQPAMNSGMISALISFVIGVLLFVFLMKFSRKTKSGLESNDGYLLNEGFSGLAVYFRIIGIVLIIAIIFILLALLAIMGQA